MASVSDKTQHSYADADEFIQYQLEKARNRIKATDLLTAGVLVGLLLVGYILTFTLLDHWVVAGGFGAWTRVFLLATMLGLCGAILFRYVARPWFRRIHPLYAARILDRSSEEIQGSLLALVDLQAAGHKSEGAIHRTLEKRAAVTLAEVHVDEAIDRRILTRMGTGLFIITLITCIYAVISPKSISLLRPLTFASTSVATRTVIEAVQPGNASVPAGSQLEIVADLSGILPDEVCILYSTSDRRFADERLVMSATDDEHRFQVRIVGDGERGIRQKMTYRIEAGDAISETFAITVEQPPTAHVTEVRYVYPAYMDLPERTDTTGAIEAWEGTTLDVRAESSESVIEAILQMSDDAAFAIRGEELRMQIDETRLSVEWPLTKRDDGTFPKFYRIQVTNPEGHKDPEPVVYPVDVRRDAPPLLKLIDPARDLEVPSNAIVPLLVEAEDPDFLLRSVTLHYAINGKLVQPSEVLLDAFQTGLTKRWADTWNFHLKPLNLNPGDVVTFHLEARDNRPPLGNQSRTGDLNLQISVPVTEQRVQEQLAQDRQMQDQMRQPETENQRSDQKHQDDNQTTEQEQPGDTTEEPSQNPDAAHDPDNEQPSDSKNPDVAQRGEDSKQGKNSESKNGDSKDQDPSQKNTDADQSLPAADGASNRRRDQRAEDDKALQKLIQRMNREPKQPESDENQQREASKNDRDRSDTDSNAQGPKTDPRERSENGEKSNPGNDRKDNSNPPEHPRDSSGGEENKNDKQGRNAEEQTNDAGETSDDPGSDPTMSEDHREGKKPSPGSGDARNNPSKSDSDSASDETRDESQANEPGAKSSADVAAMEKPKNGEGTDEDTSEVDPGGKSGSNETPGNDPGASKSDELKDPENSEGAADPESPSGAPDEKNQDPASEESATSETKPEEKAGEQQAVDHQREPPQKGNPSEKSGEQTGSKSTHEPGENEPPTQSENTPDADQQTDPNKTGGNASNESGNPDEKSGGEKSGGEKSGGEKSGGEKSGGEKSGGEKPGDKPGKDNGGGEAPGGQQTGSGSGGVKDIQRSNPNSATANAGDEPGQGIGGEPGGIEGGQENSGSGTEPKKSVDPQADAAASAAALAIKRLQQELDRGNVDQKLLDELGWTESDIKSFAERLQKQLAQREANAQQQKEKSISEKSFDAMLKGLDLESTGTTRQGNSDRDRDQQDTTIRQSAPPGRYRQLVEGYQRSVSGAKDSKP